MTDEMLMRKRPARTGEIGLFPENEISGDTFEALPRDSQLLIAAKTTERSTKQWGLAWALAQKLSEACDWLDDKDVAMDWMLIQARHVRTFWDPKSGRMEIIPKSIRWAALGGQAFSRIFDRMIYQVTTQIVPGLAEGPLRAEIESMVGMGETPHDPQTGEVREVRHVERKAKPAAKVIPAPTKAAEWLPYVEASVKTIVDINVLRKWWNDGRRLRERLKLPAETVDKGFEAFEARLHALGG